MEKPTVLDFLGLPESLSLNLTQPQSKEKLHPANTSLDPIVLQKRIRELEAKLAQLMTKATEATEVTKTTTKFRVRSRKTRWVATFKTLEEAQTYASTDYFFKNDSTAFIEKIVTEVV